ncbi:MAG: holo-ACP synthase [Gemmatimonadales bacterium]
MIVGIGLDIVETGQLRRLLTEQGDRFEQRVFTANERRTCNSRADREQALAARFAAKEACLKALGTGVDHGLSFLQVEIVEQEGGGGPALHLTGAAAERARERGVRHVHVSLSHQPGMAAAAVVLEG